MRTDIKNPNLIIKNGIFLFIRLLFVLVIAFYTTRLTLQVLGEENYGINNIIGGVISMFSIISMPITSTFQRFFNVEFTKKVRPEGVVFSSTIRIVLILSLVMVLLYETVGIYLINNVLNYPHEKTWIVNIIFQLSVITSVITFFILPYSALLYAKENMGIPATIEIINSLLKLGLLFLIPYVSVDVLISYTVAVLLIHAVQLLYFIVYCNLNYPQLKEEKCIDKNLQKDIFKFAGWSTISAVAGIAITYLSNIFINVFGGVLYNTAYGISSQLSNAVNNFSSTVLKAVDPQITNSTVADQDSYRNKLSLSTMKLTFLVTGLIYVLFTFYGQPFLIIWLGNVPDYVSPFCKVSLLTIVFTSIILPLRTIILATGEIKKLFAGYGVLSLSAILTMYLMLNARWPVIVVMYLIMAVRILYFFLALILVNSLTNLKWFNVLIELGKVAIVLSLSYLFLFIGKDVLIGNLLYITLYGIGCVMTLSILLLFTILNRDERRFIVDILKKIKSLR